MGILLDVIESRAKSADNDFWYQYPQIPTLAGVPVSEQTAMAYSAVYACVNVISKTIASLPLILYRRLDKGKERAYDNNLYNLFRYAPNGWQNSFRFIQMLQSHLLLWGNAYAVKQTSKIGDLTALWPIPPDRVKVYSESNVLKYVYFRSDGENVEFKQDQILHLAGLGYDGVVGYSPISLAREAIGLGIATEKFGSAWFGNDARPGGVLVHPGKLKKEDKEALREDWERLHKGSGNANRVALLEQGLQWQPVSLPPQDSQFLETRKFQKREIASIFNVPPHMIGDLEDATFSNIEAQALEFVQYTLQPWISLWEQELYRTVISPYAKDLFVEYLVDNLLRGDTEARSNFYRAMTSVGAFSINDVRAKENMNPIEGGDTHFVPLNMVPLDTAIALAEDLASGGGSLEDDFQKEIEGEDEEDDTRQLIAAKRNADVRRIARGMFLPRFEDLCGKIIRSEIREIRKALKKFSQRDASQFRDWVVEFYREHESWIAGAAMPLWLSYSAEIRQIAGDGMSVPNTADLDGFVRSFVETWVARHVATSKNEILRLSKDTQELGELAADEIVSRLDKWESTRVKREARYSVVEGDSAFASSLWVAAGVTRKIWITHAKNCKYCNSLAGKTISIRQPFAQKGDFIRPEGAAPLKILGNRNYPPIHPNCDCSLGAV